MQKNDAIQSPLNCTDKSRFNREFWQNNQLKRYFLSVLAPLPLEFGTRSEKRESEPEMSPEKGVFLGWSSARIPVLSDTHPPPYEGKNSRSFRSNRGLSTPKRSQNWGFPEIGGWNVPGFGVFGIAVHMLFWRRNGTNAQLLILETWRKKIRCDRKMEKIIWGWYRLVVFWKIKISGKCKKLCEKIPVRPTCATKNFTKKISAHSRFRSNERLANLS